MKAKTSERVPSIPVAQPGPVGKLTGKKSRKRFWKKKAQGGSKTPGSAPKGVAGGPPKAPEDFSQNWKALQEVRRWRYLPQRPPEQSIRKEPKKGQMVTFLPNQGTSSTRSGRPRRQLWPPPQPRPLREELEVVRSEVAAMLKGRILVGHALHNDLKVLFLDHPRKKIRDTQKYKPFKQQVKSGRPSLKLLSEKILGIRVQKAEHCSIQDAQAAMRLYIMVKRDWESMARDRRPPASAQDRRSEDA
ncbi:PREDICTED: RNA exonuclease 4 isoform X4 [Chinchilla lanigera]|uniref:RNA exonuclease 4 isoform X4 n=1 Tax=Chinchilla lanigera TaxID=34839 RepID=UPI00038EB738|nr:PREDICTED: RNA exonuclease 4 isoform X4 [Chinchilla lanigera]